MCDLYCVIEDRGGEIGSSSLRMFSSLRVWTRYIRVFFVTSGRLEA